MTESGSDVIEWTFGFFAGRLLRRQAVFELQSAAMRRGLGFRYVEDRGWLSSRFSCSVAGERAAVSEYAHAVGAWLERLQCATA